MRGLRELVPASGLQGCHEYVSPPDDGLRPRQMDGRAQQVALAQASCPQREPRGPGKYAGDDRSVLPTLIQRHGSCIEDHEIQRRYQEPKEIAENAVEIRQRSIKRDCQVLVCARQQCTRRIVCVAWRIRGRGKHNQRRIITQRQPSKTYNHFGGN